MKKKHLILFLLMLTFLCLNVAFADDGDSIYNSEAYPDSTYKKGVEPPFSKKSANEITINPVDGNVEVKQTDLYLKGRNGLDFDLTRTYCLSESNTYEPDASEYNNKKYNGMYVLTYLDNNYDLGAGWSFDLPYVESRGGYRYLHNGAAGTWTFYYNVDSEDNFYAKDYKLKDIQLQCDSLGSYSCGGRTSLFIMKEKDGKKTYFDSEGKLLGIKDRFGNEIRFYYKKVYDAAHDEDKYLLNKVIDTVGRQITLTYDSVNKITVSVSDGVATKTIIYNKIKINTHSTDIVDDEYLLDSVIDSENRKTTYTYDFRMALANYFRKNPNYRNPNHAAGDYSEESAENYYACLAGVIYPTGGKTCFDYELFTKHCGEDGSMEAPRAIKSYDLTKTGVKKDEKTYSYMSYFEINDNHDTDTSDSHDGYPYTEYYFFDELYSDDDYIKSFVDTFQTKATTIDNLNNSELATYDRKFLCKDILRQGTGFKNETINAYDSKKTLTKTTNRIYNTSTNKYMDKIEMFTYNSYRDLTEYWDPQALGDKSGTLHKVSMTYNPDYHFLTRKTYKKDADIIHVDQYDVTENGKSVQFYKIFEKSTVKKKVEYIYDTYGNVIEERLYNFTDDGNLTSNYFTTYYSYGDNVPSRLNSFDGLLVTRKWNTEIMDMNDYVEARSGNEAGTIDELYKYDYFGNLVESQDGNGYVTKLEHDKLDRISKMINADNTYKSWTYSNTANTVTVRDERGNQIKYGFDEFGNKSYIKDLVTNKDVNSYHYDSNHRLDYEYNNNDQKRINYSYSKDSRLISKEITDYLHGSIKYTEEYTYNDCYNDAATGKNYAVTTIEVLGDSTAPTMKTLQYADIMNRVVKVERIHNENGTIKTYTDLVTYDNVGNKIEEKNAKANDEGWSEPWTAKYEYNYENKPVKVYNINGDYISNEYNEFGKVCRVIDVKGNKASTPYYTTNYYDEIGRLILEKIPFVGSSSIKYTEKRHYYDRNGNVVKEMVANNKPEQSKTYSETIYEYNNRNMLTKVTTYDNEIPKNYTQYFPDACGNVLRMYTGLSSPLTINGLDTVTANGDSSYSVTKYDYNQFNKIIKMTDSLGKSETYDYDLNGNMLNKVDRNGNETKITYDVMDRPLEKTVYNSDGTENESYSYQYTLTGQRKYMSGGGIDTSYKFDDLGLVRIANQSNNISKEYGYDANGNRTSLVLKKGSSIKQNLTYTYDKMGRLYQVLNNGQVVAEYTYDENGNRQSLINPSNGNSVEYTYNLANLLTKLVNKKGSSTISQFDYNYYMDGNQESKSDSRSAGSTGYVYDGLGRLVKVTEPNSALTLYDFDDYNNIKTKTVSGVQSPSVADYKYDKNNRLLTETQTEGTIKYITKYQYDNNGNQISKSKETLKDLNPSAIENFNILAAGEGDIVAGKDVSLYQYDGFNQLVGVTVGGQKSDYTYDGDGLRQSKTINGDKITQVWDDSNVVFEFNGAGTVTNNYVRGINLISNEDSTGAKTFYMHNGHGDVVQLTNNSGGVVKDYNYDAYGNEKNIDDSDSNVFRYSSEYFDKETGTIYLRARYYDPMVGRFISEDTNRGKTQAPLSLNLYAYCKENPINHVDPNGHEAVTITLGNYRPIDDSKLNLKTFVDSTVTAIMIYDGCYEVKLLYEGGAYLVYKIRAASAAEAEAIATREASAVQGTVNSAKGLIGKDFENFLTKELNGSSSFKSGGREFDGAVGNTWWEAKSGNYWRDITSSESGLAKFKSDMGDRLNIARQNGATYELHSNTPIPQNIKDWLTKKGIPFMEW